MLYGILSTRNAKSFASKTPRYHEQAKQEFVTRFVGGLEKIRMGNVQIGNDWREYKGKGLIISSANNFRIATPEEKKNTKVLVALGLHYHGPKYAARELQSMVDCGFIEKISDATVFNYIEEPIDRNRLYTSAYLSGNLDATGPSSEKVLADYIIPKFIDEHGNYIDSSEPLSLVGHSTGGAFHHIVENTIRDAFLISPEKYGLAKSHSLRMVEHLMSKLSISSFGIQLVNPEPQGNWHDIAKTPFASAVHIMGSYDILSPKNPDYIGADILFNKQASHLLRPTAALVNDKFPRLSPFSALHDPHGHNRLMVIMEPDSVPLEIGQWLNVGGHVFGGLLQSVTSKDTMNYADAIGDHIKDSINNGPVNWGEYGRRAMRSNVFDSKALATIAIDEMERGPINLRGEGYIKALKTGREINAWRELGKNHALCENEWIR